MIAHIAHQPSLLEDRFGIVPDLEAGECRRLREHAAWLAIEPGVEVLHPRHEQLQPRDLAHRVQPFARFVEASREAERHHADVLVGAEGDARRLERQQTLEVPRHVQRLLDAGGHVRIEPPCLAVRGDPLLVEAAVAAGMDETGKQLGIVAVATGLAEQPHQRPFRESHVGLEVRVELVRDGEARIERERAAKRLFGSRLAVRRDLDELADDAMAPAQVRPRRREPRVEVEALLIEVARGGEAVVRT